MQFWRWNTLGTCGKMIQQLTERDAGALGWEIKLTYVASHQQVAQQRQPDMEPNIERPWMVPMSPDEG